ncbi:helix-turn-helix transcriptional regulator [Geminocystis herdmanii]|uniref:helix-turn-helix transcriptional regulator n=1 Tax=Geminocystis herdmanii TaxID=669359 RepID=UPI0003467EAB|nr:AraC family transcriptional regulator [Geminocystis herdmanii]
MIKLSTVNWANYWQQESESFITSSGEKELIWREKGLLGYSTEKYIPLRNGLYLEISDYQMYENIVLTSQYNDQNDDHFVVNFVVSGNVKTIHHGITDYVLETAGKNYIEFWDSRQETEYWQKGDRILKVRVGISLENLREMCQDSCHTLPSELQLLIKGKNVPPYYRQGENNINMNSALNQIINCPYQGFTRNFYLESKALELFALWLGENNNQEEFYQQSSLSKKDIIALEEVKNIMEKNLQNPPSLKELSRQLCINEYKLKSGFKELFNTTIFGYLHGKRMEYAHSLLTQKKMKVTDVAQMCGYASLPSFSKAFKKYFGVNPKFDRIKK